MARNKNQKSGKPRVTRQQRIMQIVIIVISVLIILSMALSMTTNI